MSSTDSAIIAYIKKVGVARGRWNFLIVYIGAINCATFLYGFGSNEDANANDKLRSASVERRCAHNHYNRHIDQKRILNQ